MAATDPETTGVWNEYYGSSVGRMYAISRLAGWYLIMGMNTVDLSGMSLSTAIETHFPSRCGVSPDGFTPLSAWVQNIGVPSAGTYHSEMTLYSSYPSANLPLTHRIEWLLQAVTGRMVMRVAGAGVILCEAFVAPYEVDPASAHWNLGASFTATEGCTLSVGGRIVAQVPIIDPTLAGAGGRCGTSA